MSDRIETLLVDLEKELQLKASDEDKDKSAKVALVKQAAETMSDDEKKEARKAFDTEDTKKAKKSKKSNDDMDKKDASDHDKKKDAMDHDDKKDAKKSNDDMDKKDASDHEDKEKIASLTAKLNHMTSKLDYMTAKPYIEKMLTAREKNGMGKEDWQNFGRSLYGKTTEEIKARYEEDKILFNNQLSASDDIFGDDIPFNGTGSLSASDKSLEELFN